MSSSYVLILPDGKEYFFDDKERNNESLTKTCENILFREGIRTNRKDPQPINVPVYQLMFKKGEIVRFKLGDYSITPFLESMTEEEFEEEIKLVLEKIPQEFHDFVMKDAWEDSEYESVFDRAEQLVSELKPVIAKFKDRVQKEVAGFSIFGEEHHYVSLHHDKIK